MLLAAGPAPGADAVYQKLSPETGFDLHASCGGTAVQLTDWRGEEGHPSVSPDGRSLAFHAERSGDFEIWLMDLASREVRRLTRDVAVDIEPVFDPGGSSIYFVSDRGGSFDVWRIDVASGRTEQVTDTPTDTLQPEPSPDGRRLAFSQSGYVAWRWYVGTVDLRTRRIEILSEAGHCRPAFSPDGRFLYYSSRRGRHQHSIVRRDLQTGREIDVVDRDGMTYYDVRVSADGGRLLLHGYPGRSTGEARVYEVDLSGRADPSPLTGTNCMYPEWLPASPLCSPPRTPAPARTPGG